MASSHIRLEKKGIRGLAIAESFAPGSAYSRLAGVVMRRDLVIDGFVFGNATIEGDDSTEQIISMYKELSRQDISYLLLSGMVISLYNIVDIVQIRQRLKIPIIGITYEGSEGLESAIQHHFPTNFQYKVDLYRRLGPREKIILHTGKQLYIRKEGCTLQEVRYLLGDLTIQGKIPEPVRIAQLLARSVLKKQLS